MTCSMLLLRSELALGLCPRAITAVVRTRSAVARANAVRPVPIMLVLRFIWNLLLGLRPGPSFRFRKDGFAGDHGEDDVSFGQVFRSDGEDVLGKNGEVGVFSCLQRTEAVLGEASVGGAQRIGAYGLFDGD